MLAACSASAEDDAPAKVPHDIAWSTYQHSADRNAVFEGYTLPHDWAYDAKAKVNSGLALVGSTLLFTTFSHQLVALDVRSGRVLWSAPISNIAMSTPIVAGNTVYVGTGKSGVLHRSLIQKIQFSGKDVWGVHTGDEIAAFDLHTGAPRWTFKTVGEDMPSAVYTGGKLIFANGDWHAYALRGDTGREVWSTDIGGVSTMANAVMAGNSVIVATCKNGMTDSNSLALDPSTGKILWRSPYGHCDASPSYADGKVFVEDAEADDMYLRARTLVAALDAKTGRTVWAYRAPKLGVWSIVASDEAAIAGTYADGMYYQPAPLTDEIIAFDANTGKVRWTFQTSGPVKMSPVIAHGRLYAGDTVGVLYTLDARTGKLLELREFRQAFTTSPPIVAGNKLLVVNGTKVLAMPLSGKPNLPVADSGS